MRIIKFSRRNLRPLEAELDRIGLKHGIEPRSPFMPTPDDLFDDDDSRND